MQTSDVILTLLFLVLVVLCVAAYLKHARRIQGDPLPPPPKPTHPAQDPLPSPKHIEDLDAHIEETNSMRASVEAERERPTLLSDFVLDRPDPAAVDLLNTLSGEDSGHEHTALTGDSIVYDAPK